MRDFITSIIAVFLFILGIIIRFIDFLVASIIKYLPYIALIFFAIWLWKKMIVG